MKQKILIAILALVGVMPLQGRTIRDFVAQEPDQVFQLVPHTARLDMFDYFDSGQQVDVTNRLGDDTRLLEMDSDYVKIQTSASRVVEVLMLQHSKRDTILAVIETVKTPVPDSRLRFFNSNWVELSSIKPLKQMPVLADFFLPSAPKDQRKKLVELLPFTLIELTFTGSDHHTMVARHGLDQYLDKQDFRSFKPYLRPTVTYQITGSKFKRVQ